MRGQDSISFGLRTYSCSNVVAGFESLDYDSESDETRCASDLNPCQLYGNGKAEPSNFKILTRTSSPDMFEVIS